MEEQTNESVGSGISPAPAMPELGKKSDKGSKRLTYTVYAGGAVLLLSVGVFLYSLMSSDQAAPDPNSNLSRASNEPKDDPTKTPTNKGYENLRNLSQDGARRDASSADSSFFAPVPDDDLKRTPITNSTDAAAGGVPNPGGGSNGAGQGGAGGQVPPAVPVPGQGGGGQGGGGGEQKQSPASRFFSSIQVNAIRAYLPSLGGFERTSSQAAGVRATGAEQVAIQPTSFDSDTSSAKASTSASTNATTKKADIKMGDEVYAINWYNLNSRNLNTPVKVKILKANSPLNGEFAMGKFELVDNRSLVLKFNTVNYKGQQYPIEAVAIDPATDEAGGATEVSDYRWAMKILSAGVTFASKLGQVILQEGQVTTSVPGSNGIVSQTQNPVQSTTNRIVGAIGETASAELLPSLKSQIDSYVPQVKLAKGYEFKMVFLKPVVLN